MAKRVGGFVVHNQEMMERWEKLIALQEAGANLSEEPTSAEPEQGPEGPEVAQAEAPEPEPPVKPEPNPCEAEPDPHSDIGEPVPIIKVVRGP